MKQRPLPPERLSALIGKIYDGAIQPDRWPATIAEICGSIGCLSGLLLLIDLQRSQHRLAYAWGMSPGWEQRFLKHSQYISQFYQMAFRREICPDGEPQLLSRLVAAAGPRAQSVYAELLQSEGVSEAMQTVVLRQARRLAVFGANRQKDAGALTDDARTIMRLLVPHIRRAVTISDILDMKKLEAHALAATLDSYSIGVIVVAERRRIMYANHAARRMFSVDGPVSGADGLLKARDSAADRQLTEAIARAQRDEGMIGAAGIGVPLTNPMRETAIAHVLPLAHGNLRTRLMPQATAAVFITEAEGPPIMDIDAVAASFGLTPAEARTLQHLAGGATVMETAHALGISINTTKTHLARIFSKTGAPRQADLIALVHRLMPPIYRPRDN
jgi:DNA-binding CsgD family transcriptional regulator